MASFLMYPKLIGYSSIHHGLEKFKKTTFTLFHALSLVNAVPKTRTDYPPAIEEIQKHLEVCLRRIIAPMEDENNKVAMKAINDELNKYCMEYGQANRREAFVKTANAALILLQSLTIGNSGAAVNPDSDDFLLFMMQNPALDTGSISDTRKGKLYEHLPDISCATGKKIMEVYWRDQDRRSVESEQLLEDLASLSESDRYLEWKHHHSCWESLRAFDSLKITRPASYNHNQDYAATPLKEHGHANFGETRNEVHPINGEWCAKDAASVFYNTFGRDHIMNVAIDDDLLRVWYFDHESPIQTSAFNFIEDLPYFLLFLFALQRFSLADWGYIDTLSPVNSKVVDRVNLSEDFENNEDPRNEMTFERLDNENDRGHRQFSLGGRATHVIYGILTAGGKYVSVVLKLSWREKVRFPEGTFLREASKRLREAGCLDACEYLPVLLAEKDFPEFSTDIIRRKLMISITNEATRQPYFIVLTRYEPLTVRTRDWMAFFDDYIALIYCHFMLWSVGIEHADISVGNLMWDPQTQKPKLCDFDLSYFSDHEQIGFKNTGTLMFMASDLLFKEAMKGKVKRLYRHDLESFVAVFIWIIFRYDEGHVIPDTRALREWIANTPSEYATAREETYQALAKAKRPDHIPRKVWQVAIKVAVKCWQISRRGEDLRQMQDMSTSEELSFDGQQEEFSPEDQKQLDHLRSIKVITDFLQLFAHDSCSDFVRGIAQKIKVCVEFLQD